MVVAARELLVPWGDEGRVVAGVVGVERVVVGVVAGWACVPGWPDCVSCC